MEVGAQRQNVASELKAIEVKVKSKAARMTSPTGYTTDESDVPETSFSLSRSLTPSLTSPPLLTVSQKHSQ